MRVVALLVGALVLACGPGKAPDEPVNHPDAGCMPGTWPQICAAHGVSCGNVNLTDGCGVPVRVVCPCPDGGAIVCADDAGSTEWFKDCSGTCVDTQHDFYNCGGCGMSCASAPQGSQCCNCGAGGATCCPAADCAAH